MELLIAYVLGAASAAALILLVLRRHAGGDATVHESLGEFRGLLDGVRNQQDRLAAQATQWSQLLGRSDSRGRWGELTLANIVEAAGLREHIDFDTQLHVTGEDGAGRPDLVLRLPTGGRIPVDSKAVWTRYEEALRTGDPRRRQDLTLQHARDVRKCVHALSTKAYWSLFPVAPEMVVLFVPSEAAFAAAVAADPDLLGFAIERRVVVTTPSTLFALLQVVAVGWHQAELSRNADEIRQLGAQLVKRLGSVAEQLAKTSRGLDSAVRAHNEVVGSFDGKLLNTARRMGERGVAGADELVAPASAEVAVRAPAP
jgi:DNA recombination protein RmuC